MAHGRWARLDGEAKEAPEFLDSWKSVLRIEVFINSGDTFNCYMVGSEWMKSNSGVGYPILRRKPLMKGCPLLHTDGSRHLEDPELSQ